MIGSKIRVKVAERPRQEADRRADDEREESSPWPRVESEYQVKRRMPWSISPRLANGSST
jgi:hypothetical protein